MVYLRRNYAGLLRAAEDGNRENALLYIDKGANVNYRAPWGETPLHIAVTHGHENVARLLLDKGANIEELNINGWTALYISAEIGNEEMVKLLLDRGANRYAYCQRDQVLHVAARYGHANVVMLLLDEGVIVDDVNRDGDTALHLAAENGHSDVVGLLLGRGAKTDKENYASQTPLDVARLKNELGIVELLNNYRPPEPPPVPGPVAPVLQENRILIDTLIQIACNQVEPAIGLLRERINPANVVNLIALLAGHNIVLIALRGGLLNEPYSTVGNDPDWFTINLYLPIIGMVMSHGERDIVMKMAYQAESLGIIRNSFNVRFAAIIGERIERRMETIGTVVADVYKRIYNVEAGLQDVTAHSQSIGLALQQFHEAYQRRRRMDRIAAVLRLLTSVIPFAATAVGDSIGLGVELLLVGVEEVANQAIDIMTDVDLSDFRVAQWIISERYQQCLPPHIRELFEREAAQTFGGMLELENCIREMMEDSNVTPLANTRRNAMRVVPPLSPVIMRPVPPRAANPNAWIVYWSAEFNTFVDVVGMRYLSIEDATALASRLSGKTEARCRSVLRQVGNANTGAISQMRFLLAMANISIN